MTVRQKAILLVGPTGSGKTPLGEFAEKQGYNNNRCSHFDFGASLRNIDSSKAPVGKLYESDINFIHKVLTEGALLDNEKFYIAEDLLKNHISANTLRKEDYLILNGLPRHVGQASAIDKIVNITNIIYLHCTPEIVYKRITQNIGGDRTNRIDDTTEEIAAKLKIFETRTKPILNHYTRKQIPVSTVNITEKSTPETVWASIT